MRKAKKCLIAAFLCVGLYVNAFADTSTSNGYKVYTQNCTVCHDEDGTGLMPGVPDLNKSNDLHMRTVEQLVERIKQGSKNSDLPVVMPPKGGNPNLSDDDIRDVVIYMRKTFTDYR